MLDFWFVRCYNTIEDKGEMSMFGLWLIAFVSGVAFAHLFGSGVSLNNEMNEIVWVVLTSLSGFTMFLSLFYILINA